MQGKQEATRVAVGSGADDGIVVGAVSFVARYPCATVCASSAALPPLRLGGGVATGGGGEGCTAAAIHAVLAPRLLLPLPPPPLPTFVRSARGCIAH